VAVEEQKQHEPKPKDRGGHADDRNDPGHMVGEAIAAHGGQDAQGDADEEAQEKARHGQFQGRRKKVGQIAGHGPMVADRLPQVALRQAAHVAQVLHGHGPVQAVLLADGFHRRLAGLGADNEQGRITGNGVRNDERENAHADEHRNRGQDALDDVGEDSHARDAPWSGKICLTTATAYFFEMDSKLYMDSSMGLKT
jgi:hypothetical protein